MLNVLETKRNRWQVFDATLGRLCRLLGRAVQGVESYHAIRCGYGKSLRMGHEADGRYRVARYHELNVSVEAHALPDLDDTVGASRDVLNLLLVLANGHLRLHSVVLLISTLMHRVLWLDNDHAGDDIFMRISFIMR